MLARRECGLAILALLCLQAPGFGQQAFWRTDLEGAKRLAAQTNRLVLVHFSAPWCQPCARLEENVFRKPGFAGALDAQYVGVKLNLDENHKLAAQYGVQAIPADVIITPQGQVVQRLQSPPTIDNYVGVMQQVAARAGRTAAPTAIAQQPAMQPAAPPQAATPPQEAAANAAPRLSDDRYADYFSRLGSTPGANPQPPVAAPAAQPPAVPDRYAANQATAPALPSPPPPEQGRSMLASMSTPSAAQPPLAARPPLANQATNNPGVASQAVANEPAGRSLQLPPGSPPLGLDGYCPVTLVEKQGWREGDVRFGAIHHGRTYLFAGPVEQQRFLANPDAFSPVMSGDDPVLALDENRSVPGKRKHGVFFGKRIYLFSNEATLTAFSKNPGRYAPEITQARR